MTFPKFVLLFLGCMMTAAISGVTQADTPKVGIVVMHGKGGSPSMHVSGLVSGLREEGYLVANLEMPWSGQRDYDVDVTAAEQEVEQALTVLRNEGAQKVFVAGHSQGGAFALYLAGRLELDGVACIAPGGNVGSKKFRGKLGSSVKRARELVAEGKGGEKTRLEDFEGKKGTYPIVTTPAIYLTWFDPDGAMNTRKSAARVDPDVPILWLVARDDYPGLRKANIPLFNTFPEHPHTKMVEPDSDHIGAPSASREAIVSWITEIITSQ